MHIKDAYIDTIVGSVHLSKIDAPRGSWGLLQHLETGWAVLFLLALPSQVSIKDYWSIYFWLSESVHLSFLHPKIWQ